MGTIFVIAKRDYFEFYRRERKVLSLPLLNFDALGLSFFNFGQGQL
jgi:hypothetical protein